MRHKRRAFGFNRLRMFKGGAGRNRVANHWWRPFVVDAASRLWIADRRSEHIACARGGRVQTAGELEFEVGESGVEVVGATNQSTGFCPCVESWEALELALDAAGLPRPPIWTRGFEFRRCEQCGELNVVKEVWFVCNACDAELPTLWNIGNSHNDM